MSMTYTDLNLFGEPKTAEIPCQNCGRLVTVTLPFIGCVFCGDCIKADSGWNDGTEDFYEPRRLGEEHLFGDNIRDAIRAIRGK